MDTKIFTRNEFAEKLQVSLTTLFNWEKQGIIKPSRIGRRVYFTEAHLNEILEK